MTRDHNNDGPKALPVNHTWSLSGGVADGKEEPLITENGRITPSGNQVQLWAQANKTMLGKFLRMYDVDRHLFDNVLTL